MKRFVWRGPPTAVEIWSEGDTPALLFSGPVSPGFEFPADLPEAHGQIASWRAFKLIEIVEVAPAPALPARKTKDEANG